MPTLVSRPRAGYSEGSQSSTLGFQTVRLGTKGLPILNQMTVWKPGYPGSEMSMETPGTQPLAPKGP